MDASRHRRVQQAATRVIPPSTRARLSLGRFALIRETRDPRRRSRRSSARRDPSASASRVSRGDERAPCTLEDTRRGSAPRGGSAARRRRSRRRRDPRRVASVAAVVGASSAVLAALAAVKRAADEAAESRRARIREKAARRVDPALADGARPPRRAFEAIRPRRATARRRRALFFVSANARRFGARAKGGGGERRRGARVGRSKRADDARREATLRRRRFRSRVCCPWRTRIDTRYEPRG